MKNRLKFADILKEEDDQKSHGGTRMDISIGLLHKAMEHLTNAVRDVESAAQYMEDEDKKKKIEEFKASLIGEFGTQFSNFNDNYDGADRLINKLDKFIKDNSQNKDNFNLNNSDDKEAPTGDYVNGHFPGEDSPQP